MSSDSGLAEWTGRVDWQSGLAEWTGSWRTAECHVARKGRVGRVRQVGLVGRPTGVSRGSGLVRAEKNADRRSISRASGAHHHYLGRRQATHTPAQPVGGDIAPLMRVFPRRRRGRGLLSSTEPPSAGKAHSSKRDRRLYKPNSSNLR